MGPHAPPDLRPRAADERRLLAAAHVPRPGRLRERLQPDAPGRRDDLADAGLPRPARGAGQLRSTGSRWPCATSRASSWPSSTSTRCTRPTGRPRPSRSSARPTPSTPAWPTCCTKTNPCYVSGRLEGLASCRTTTTSGRCARRRPRSATSSRSWAGRRSSPSRPATRCTGPTRRSPCGRPRRAAPTCSSTRSSA